MISSRLRTMFEATLFVSVSNPPIRPSVNTPTPGIRSNAAKMLDPTKNTNKTFFANLSSLSKCEEIQNSRNICAMVVKCTKKSIKNSAVMKTMLSAMKARYVRNQKDAMSRRGKDLPFASGP